ncbi:unnamed protein product [Mucor circinelloides]
MYNYCCGHNWSTTLDTFIYYSTVIPSTANCAEISMTLLATVYMALLRCSRSTSMRADHIPIDSILTLALNTQYYAKIQPEFDVFDACFLELEAVLDCQNSTQQLLLISSYLVVHFLNFFGTKKSSSMKSPKKHALPSFN